MQYKAESSSTKITVFADYLDTLSLGNHTLQVRFTDGTSATATFTIAEGEPPIIPDKPWVNPFADVRESDWFYSAVAYVHQNGLMTGTAADEFSPQMTLTRGMIVTVLYHMQEAVPAIAYANPFDDVDDGAYYADAVKWAYHNGIVAGYGNGKFGPDDNLTREQMATILLNYQKFTLETPPIMNDSIAFTDAGDISGWAKEAVDTLTKQGMISGKPGNIFDPKGNATRAEFAALIMRFFQAMED